MRPRPSRFDGRFDSRFDWSGAASDALREDWDAGLTAGQIADRLTRRFSIHVTKNMVVGRKNRMGLPSRPSPITGVAAERKPRPVRERSAGQAYAPRLVPTLAAVEAPPPVAVIERPHRAGEGCKFPLWGDGRPDHRYCDAPRAGSSSYCGTHHRLCNVRPVTLTETQREAYAHRANVMRAHRTHNDGRAKLFSSTRLAGEIW